jgi:hypothetical protein
MVRSNQFGAVVNEITPKQLEVMRIPLASKEERLQIDRLMKRAVTLRWRGAMLLAKSERLFHEMLALPLPDQLEANYMSSPPDVRVQTFSVRASELGSRLDASHHIPEARAVKESLAGTGLTEKTLGEVADIVIPARFKRVYTNAQHGTPFLQGRSATGPTASAWAISSGRVSPLAACRARRS